MQVLTEAKFRTVSGPTQKVAMNVIYQMTLKPALDKLLKINEAGVAKLADAQDLKSWAPQGACGFESRPRHQLNQLLSARSPISPKFPEWPNLP
jgi:hypothetical protein